MSCLRCEEVRFAYGSRTLLDGVSLEISQGEFVCLTGSNGAGKTTLLSILCGERNPDAGRVIWGDEDITSLNLVQRARAGIGFLAQSSTVLNRASVEENLSIVAELLPGVDPAEAAEPLLEKFQLGPLRRQRPLQLSGGERRKLELARSLLTKPKILILDEPLSGLDAEASQEVCHLLSELSQEIGVLICEHRVELLRPLVKRGYRLHAGQLTAGEGVLDGNA